MNRLPCVSILLFAASAMAPAQDVKKQEAGAHPGVDQKRVNRAIRQGVEFQDRHRVGDHPGGACPVARKDCVNCHMQKFQVVDIPVKFTDHQIRVIRANDTIPK